MLQKKETESTRSEEKRVARLENASKFVDELLIPAFFYTKRNSWVRFEDWIDTLADHHRSQDLSTIGFSHRDIWLAIQRKKEEQIVSREVKSDAGLEFPDYDKMQRNLDAVRNVHAWLEGRAGQRDSGPDKEIDRLQDRLSELKVMKSQTIRRGEEEIDGMKLRRSVWLQTVNMDLDGFIRHIQMGNEEES